MANRFWVGGTGTWDAVTTTNWSATSGGAGGATVPSTADVVIFDSASNVAGAGASYTCTRTATTAVLGINMANPSAGTLTFAGSSAIGITTSGLTIAGTVNWTNTGFMTFAGTTAVCNTGTTTIASPIVINGTGITVTLNGAFSTSSSFTLTAGTIALSTFALNCSTANISGTLARTFNFGTGSLNLTGNNATIFDATTLTSFAVTGTKTINCTYAGSIGTRSITANGATGINFNYNIIAGTDILQLNGGSSTFYSNNLNFTGFGGTLTAAAATLEVNIAGNLTLSSIAGFTVNITAVSGIKFSGSGTQFITSNGKIINCDCYVASSTSIIQLQDNMTISSNFRFLLSNGTLDLNNKALTTGIFVASSTNACQIRFGASGNINLNDGGNGATLWTSSPGTFSYTGTSSINIIGSDFVERKISTGALSEAQSMNFNITAGTTNITLTSSVFLNLNFTGFSGNLSATTTAVTIYGSLTMSSTMTQSSTGIITFAATTTGKTITSAGKILPQLTFDGVGGGWTLADALNVGSNGIIITNGSFNTGNFNVSAGSISSTNANVRSITLGTSTVTLSSGVNFATSTNLTFSATESTINVTNASSTFSTGGLTFGNLAFTSTAISSVGFLGAIVINGQLSAASRATAGISLISTNSTITFGSAGSLVVVGGAGNRRFKIQSGTAGTVRTINFPLNTNTVTLSDVDFQDITFNNAQTPSATYSGTRLGNQGNNTNIVFATPKTVYWNLTGSQNWSATAWAPNSGGTPDVNYFPLAQDIAVFNDAGAATTVTMDAAWATGTIDMTARTSAMTFATTLFAPSVYGDFKLGSGISLSGTNTITMNGLGNPTVILSAGKTWLGTFTLNNAAGVTLSDAFTSTNSFILTVGTLNLNNFILTTTIFTSSNTNIRSINFGTTGRIAVTSTGTVWNTPTVTNFTTLGTTRVDCTNATATARTINSGALTEDSSISFNITAGTGTFTFTANNTVKNLNFTGFAGSWSNVAMTIYGSLTASTGMNVSIGINTVTFASTYTGNTINPNGKTLGFSITFSGLFGEWTLLNNLNTGTASIVTHVAGTLILGTRTITCPAFNTNSTYLRTLNFGTGSITVNGTGTVWDATTTYNMTVTGTPVVNVTNATATARTIIAGTHSETNSISFNISAGTSSTTVGGSVRNLVFTGFAGTLPNTARTIYGNLTLSTGMTITAGAAVTTFAATSTGKTITSSGRTINFSITFDGVGGEWTLVGDLNTATNNGITLTNGSFITNNFNVTMGYLVSNNSNIRSLTLGSSTVTITNFGTVWNFLQGVNATLNAGTSNIIFTAPGTTFSGGSKTYYNLSYTGTGFIPANGNGEFLISGNNTFINLNIAAPINPGSLRVEISDNQTINGIFTVGISTSPAHRVELRRKYSSDDSQSTLTVAAVGTLTDVDFKDIAIIGASAPWAGTRLGNGGNNSGVTFAAPKTVYWNLTGTQNWNATAWCTSTDGGATFSTPATTNFPLPQDTAVFNNTGAATTVTINGPYRFGTLDMSTRTTAMTLGNLFSDNTNFYKTIIYGDLKLGTGVTLSSSTGELRFQGYNKTQTLTSAGKTLLGNISIESTSTTLLLGDALNLGTNTLNIFSGTFSTGINYSVAAASIISQSSTVGKTFNLNNSAITLSSSWTANAIDTVNAGGSTITLTTANSTFTGAGKTYNTVTFNNTTITTVNITGSNTFTNLNIPGRTGSVGISQVTFNSNQTITGTLTIGAGTSAIYRTWLRSDTQGTARTLTVNARSTLTDLDFRDITAAGAAGTWSGTRLGDCGNNTNITTSTPKTVYWNFTAGTNWSGTVWATTSSGAPAAANFPLAQDTAAFTNTGVNAGTSVTIDANWNIGTINYSARTTASTLAIGSTVPIIYGDVTLYTGLTTSGSGAMFFSKYSGTQTITSAGRTFLFSLRLDSAGGATVALADALICSGNFLIQAGGAFNLNGFSATCTAFQSIVIGAQTRSIIFGTGAINITGNNNQVLILNNTNFSYTGTPTINLTYSGATGTRTIQATATTTITTETNSIDVNITAGTDIIQFTNFGVRNYNDTGFTGTYSTTGTLNVYGNLTARNTPGRVDFLATSGTKSITVPTYSGVLYFNCPGATYQLQRNINFFSGFSATGNIRSSSYTTGIILQSGTFDANGYNVSLVRFNSSFTSVRTLNLGSGTWTIYGDEIMENAATFPSSFESLFANKYAWYIADSTNLTLISSTSTIVLSHFTPALSFSNETPLTRYLYMGGLTYNNIVVSPLRFGTTETRKTYAIYGNNTFNTITNTAQPTTVAFEAGSTNTFTDFALSGTAGKLVSVTSTGATQATLKKATTWNIGANSVDGGGNIGLVFTGTSPNYLSFTNIIGALTGAVTYVKHRFLAFFN